MISSIEVENTIIPILRVPYFSQEDADHLCFVYSFLMLMEFFKNIYSNEKLRQIIPNTTKDELISLTKSEYGTGTSFSPQLIKDLNKAFPNMHFHLKLGTKFVDIADSLKIFHPVIVIYNISQLLYNEEGPSHAAVVIGLNDDFIVLNNPWKGWAYVVNRTEFERVWEIEGYRAIFVSPQAQKGVE